MTGTDAGADFSRGAAWIDGRLVPIAEASIPLLDWGFTRSDVTYDVVHVWDGRFFRLDAHLDRFLAAMAALRLDPGLDRAGIAAAVHGCVARSGLRRAYVEMLCTRGMPAPGVRDPRRAANRFVAFAIPFVWIADDEQRERGLRACIARTVRRIPPDAVDPAVKNFHWGDLVRGLFEAFDRDAETVILTDGAGVVTEGPGFNVFTVAAGRVATPAGGVLPGVTRRTVLELCARLDIPAAAGEVTAEDVRDADEVFLTSTAGGVMAVTEVDGKPVGEGTVGPVTAGIHDAYWASHEDPAWSEPVDYGSGV